MTSCKPACKWLASLLLSGLLTLSAWVTWDNWGRFVFPPAPATSPTDTLTTSQALQQGEYLAHIGGCIACHTAKDGETLAGGRRIDTPFGAVFSSNLTSSKTHGLGDWSAADFENALHWGRSREGRLLLPVFPYNHTSVFTSQDVQSLFVWLQTIKPVDRAQPAHRLTWPLGTQPVIAVWRSLFFQPTPFKHNENQSVEWNRGAYLVQSAGHCAACHGQRNALGSFPAVDDLSGGFLAPQMWIAPSLVDATQTSMANNKADDTADLLRIGQSVSAHASGPMAEFVQYSGQYLTPADALAIASDTSKPEAARIEALNKVMFAPGNDPRSWLNGWHPALRMAYRKAGQTPSKDTWFNVSNAPVLDLQGDQDPWRPPSTRFELQQVLGNKVTVVVVTNASHAMVPEQPVAITRAIVNWGKKLPN